MTETRDHDPKLPARLAAAGFAGLTAIAMAVAAHADAPDGAAHHADIESGYQIAQTSEAGEGGEIAEASEASADDAAFLTLLGLVEGHLRAGIELYRQGAADMAKTHMKHPGDELYVDLEPALAARGLDGFAGPLERLAVAIEGDRPLPDAEAAFAAVLDEIDRTREAAGAGLSATLHSVTNLVRTAAEEYEIAVKDGRVADPHEYQDAWGFVQAAKARMAGLSQADRQRLGQGFDDITAELDGLGRAWPSIVPPESVTTGAALLWASAERIERGALSAE
jgi:hypothetical protein